MNDLVSKAAVLRIIHSTGGCDAKEPYIKGWDDACNAMYNAVNDLVPVVNDLIPVANVSIDMSTDKDSTSSPSKQDKCHNCFGAANNDCRFCGDDGK